MHGCVERQRGRLVTRLISIAAAVSLSVLAFAAAPAMAADGAGTMTVAPSYVVSGSTGNQVTFVYTAPAGGLTNGNLNITVPSGWSTPTFANPGAAGWVSDQCYANTDSISGQTIELQGLSMTGGSSCQIIYGDMWEGPGATAPTTAGASTFTTQEQSASTGTLTTLTAGSPIITVGNDGTGTITVSPTHFVANSTGSTLTFTYTATRQMTSGELTIAVPSGFSTPSTTASAPGATTSNCGTVGVSSSTIKVTGVTLSASSTCTIVYGNKTSGPGVTAPTSGGPTPATFTVQHEATNDNNLTAIASSPKVVVTAADGSGTMIVSPANVIQSSTGNQVTFTYTAPAGGLDNGNLNITVPAGWSAPTFASPGAAGWVSDQCYANTDTISGQTIELQGVSMTGGSTCQIIYGDKWEGPGATAPSSEGASTFTTQEQSYTTGSLTALSAGSPVINVGSDGTGTMTVGTQHVYAGAAGNTLTFTYTAALTISSGELTIAIPSGGWSSPSTTPSAAGDTTSTCGTVGVSGSTVQVTGVNLSATNTCTITYGNKSGGGPGAMGPAAGGPAPIAFATQEKSSSSGTLTTLGTGSPSVIVTAVDGSGTMTVSPTSAITSSTGNQITFTYTAPAGGLDNGNVTITVPSGWSAPQFSNPGAAGWVSDQCYANTDSISGQTIELQGVSMTGGATCQIIYGDKWEGPGATAPATPGASTFTTQEQSYSTGTLTTLAAGSPTVNVGNDGLGTMTVSPTIVTSGTSGNQLTFTYTAAGSGLSNGALTIAVPSGWSTPSTTASAPGATTSTCGSVGVSGSTIQITGVNLSASSTCTIKYGNKAGGPGATAPSAGGPGSPYPFATQEKSSSSGTLTTLGNGSPSVIVVAPDATGTMTVSPTHAVNGTGQQYTFTYSAAAGGLDNGELTVQVPSGWSVPQTSNPGAAGYVIDECGQTTAIASSTIQSSGVSLGGGGTCQIIYGSTFEGPGGIAPATSGLYTFASQEKSTSGGTLGAITSPAVDVDDDGVGTLTAAPLVISAGTTGATLTFTYSAPTGVGLSGGEVTVGVPAGWPAPSTTASAPGFTSTTCAGASAHATGGTIDVTGINLAASSTCTIVYGNRGSGGPGLTVPAGTGDAQFTGSERSSTSGTLTALGSPAHLTVYAADGSGAITASPAFTEPGSNGNTVTFTYTAAAGGLSNGALALAVPSGWTTPSTSGGSGGYTSSTCGNVAVNGATVGVTSVSLPAGATCKIVYGDTSRGGAGATAPPSAGTSAFTTREGSTVTGTLTNIAGSPQIALLSADGSGTLTASPSTVLAGSSGNKLTFTYTAASGGTHGGKITVAIPSGFSSTSGFTSSDCGTAAVSGMTIQITGVNVAGGSTCTITYGSVTVPSSLGPYRFTAEEASSATGTLTNLGGSPSLTTVAAPVPPVTSPVPPVTTGTGAAGNTAPQKCVVPNLKGDSLAKAKKLLTQAHCAVGKIKQPKMKKGHKAPKLVVGSTSPRAGSKLANDAKVAITLVAAPTKR